MEYSGHGNHQGNLLVVISLNGLMMQSYQLIKLLKKEFILIGSSMGAWIALNLFKNFNKQIKGFMGSALLQNLLKE